METLNQALERAARYSDCGLRVLDRREREEWLSWPDLLERSSRLAGGLRVEGVERGETVGLFYPTGVEFFVAFFGTLLAGAVPVPLYPPVRLGRLEEYQARTARMLEAAGIQRVLADARVRRILGEALVRARCKSMTLSHISKGEALIERVEPESLGLVQFSSGTSKDPKPVALTHRALMAQTVALNGYWPDTEESQHSGVSWLPLYHDMGLIGCVFTVLERPSTLTVIPPELFVARPAAWLQALSRYRATISPAPNFAFGLCTEKIRDEELHGLDLSHWQVALCGAETVVPSVLHRFAERLAPYGFRPEALTPVYGLSEAALAVTFSEIGRPFSTRSISRHDETDAAAEASEISQTIANERELVSVGRPLPGFAIQVRDEDDRVVTGGEVGRLWIRGPSLMREYLNQPQATAAVLRDGWLDTGDLGFLHQGELYISGRAKDILIVRGANHAPDEIEAVVSDLPQVRTGCAAAVAHLPAGAEQEEIWLFVERPRERYRESDDDTERACRNRVLADTGIALDRIEVLEPGTLPRTSSGKIRRQEALALFLSGQLEPPEPVTPGRILHAVGRSMWTQFRQRRRRDAG